jgi:tRNA threonylcarbamoyladenosine biosynthesis protein TsaB
VNPRLLLIETSGQPAQVGSARGDQILGVSRLTDQRRHARDLAPAVADLLRAQHWAPADLEGVMVSRGPGSYTGLRVGVMSAKALAYATGCALLGIETFAVIATQTSSDVTRVDVIADAQQDRVYVQPFERTSREGPWQAGGPLVIDTVAGWLARRDPDAWVSGPGIERHAHRLPDGLRLVPEGCRLPRPESLLQLGLMRLRAGEQDDLWALEPIYLRPSSAEEQWQRLGRS